MVLKVNINGTDKNPYHVFGLACNPFPQIGKPEYSYAMQQINKLGAGPIPDTEYIENVLKGFHPSFIKIVCDHFVPGKLVILEVEIPDSVF